MQSAYDSDGLAHIQDRVQAQITVSGKGTHPGPAKLPQASISTEHANAAKMGTSVTIGHQWHATVRLGRFHAFRTFPARAVMPI